MVGEVLVSIIGVTVGLILLDPRFIRIWKSWLMCRFDLTSGSAQTTAGSGSGIRASNTDSRVSDSHSRL